MIEPAPLVLLDALRCACGSDRLFAISPGSEADTAPGGIVTRREVPARAWCAPCWPWAPRAAA